MLELGILAITGVIVYVYGWPGVLFLACAYGVGVVLFVAQLWYGKE